jgi:hypothetical protein
MAVAVVLVAGVFLGLRAGDDQGGAPASATVTSSVPSANDNHANHPVVTGVQPRASAFGVQVARPSVDLGHIPLNTPVSHVFRLENTGVEPVAIGQVRIQALEGC